MQIEGKDDDQPGTINSELHYRIISEKPQGADHMFTIGEKTGKLYVKEPTLDREVIITTRSGHTANMNHPFSR